MALVIKDRVKETTTTTGQGTITLAGAVSGFRSFADIGDGNSTYYVILDKVNNKLCIFLKLTIITIYFRSNL